MAQIKKNILNIYLWINILKLFQVNSTIQRGPLLWSDEFDYLSGAPRSDYWIQQTGGNGLENNELQYYTTQNAPVTNGYLSIVSKKENSNGMRYTSSRLISTRSFKYGIIEYRAKLPKGKGSWPAFWLLAAKRPLSWYKNHLFVCLILFDIFQYFF